MQEYHKIGLVAEQRALVRFLDLGYTVLRDMNPWSSTDFYLRCENDVYVKIQVKAVRKDGFSKTIRLAGKTPARKNGYDRSEVDFFVGVEWMSFYIVAFDQAYPGGKRRPVMTVGHTHLERWDLLPSPGMIHRAGPKLEFLKVEEGLAQEMAQADNGPDHANAGPPGPLEVIQGAAA